jgi:hypothetical protein
VPNSNDSPDISWLWQLLVVLEPTIYLSTNNASINGEFLDCALGEARRCAANCLRPVELLCLRQLTCLPVVELLFSVATLARPLRDGKRLLIYPYAEVLWNAMWGGAATSQYLNGTALEMTIMRGAMCESDTLTMSCIASCLLLQTLLNTTMQYEWLTKCWPLLHTNKLQTTAWTVSSCGVRARASAVLPGSAQVRSIVHLIWNSWNSLLAISKIVSIVCLLWNY